MCVWSGSYDTWGQLVRYAFGHGGGGEHCCVHTVTPGAPAFTPSCVSDDVYVQCGAGVESQLSCSLS